MDQRQIRELAILLFYADQIHFRVPPFSRYWPKLTEEDGYAIQTALMDKYRQEGYGTAGKKAGGISYRKSAKGGFGPHYGWILTHKMWESGVELPADRFFQPGVEAEIAVILNRDLRSGPVTEQEAGESIEYLLPAWEIVDKRGQPEGRKFPDSLADNASFGGCVLGAGIPREQLENYYIEVQMNRNGSLLELETGTVTIGALAKTVAWLANKKMADGEGLQAGEVILTGAMTSPLVTVEAGNQYTANFSGLGKVSVTFI